jgi:hypothetical protein
MTVAYWIVAGVLAFMYLYSGAIKIVRTPDQLRPMMAWVDTIPRWSLRAIGWLEVLGAIGLILPPLLGIAEPLAIAAAAGLALLQVAAARLHLRRNETKDLWLNAGLLVLALAAGILATTWL